MAQYNVQFSIDGRRTQEIVSAYNTNDARKIKDICSCDTAISGSVFTGTISCFSTSPHKALRTRFRR